MSADAITPQIQDVAFQEILTSFQKGEWDQGLEKLDTLIKQQPSATELQDFRQEMLIRSRIDQYERLDTRSTIQKKILLWGIVGVILVGLFSLAFSRFDSYTARIQDQFSSMQENVLEEGASLVLDIQFKDAQNYLNAGRPQDALQLLTVISEQKPDYPGLEQLRDEARPG